MRVEGLECSCGGEDFRPRVSMALQVFFECLACRAVWKPNGRGGFEAVKVARSSEPGINGARHDFIAFDTLDELAR